MTIPSSKPPSETSLRPSPAQRVGQHAQRRAWGRAQPPTAARRGDEGATSTARTASTIPFARSEHAGIIPLRDRAETWHGRKL
jgi:hypothetical protein